MEGTPETIGTVVQYRYIDRQIDSVVQYRYIDRQIGRKRGETGGMN